MTNAFRILTLSPINGYISGMQQRSVRIKARISTEGHNLAKLRAIHRLVSPVLEPNDHCHTDESAMSACEGISAFQLFLDLCAQLDETAGGVIIQRPQWEMPTSPPNDIAQTSCDVEVLLPTIDPRRAILCVNWLASRLRKVADPSIFENANASAFLQPLNKEMGKIGPNGSNNRYFIREAYKLGIEHEIFPQSMIRYGYGKNSAVFSSAMTNRSSSIATRIAKDKALTNRLLIEWGMPVAGQIYTGDAKGLLAVADRIPYPVVIKPRAMDQGKNVFVNISTPERLKEVISLLDGKYDGELLVEQHIEGEVYRINVVDGRVPRAVRRFMAGVVGDGKSTIRQLVEIVNRDPERGDLPHHNMRNIKLEGTASEVLASLGVDFNFVPPEGQFVALDWISSVSTGGYSVDCLAEVHPDNIALCIEATELLGLDVSGVDVISNDISTSWKENGATICEINAVPQLGVTDLSIYGDIIAARLDTTCQPFAYIGMSRDEALARLDDPAADLIDLAPNGQLRASLPVSKLAGILVGDDVSEEAIDHIRQYFSPHSRYIGMPSSATSSEPAG